MSDGFSVERVIVDEFARRFGLPAESVSASADDSATALLETDGKQIALQLVKAVPSAHPHNHDHTHDHGHALDHHHAPSRSAGQRLVREFHDLPAAERPFDVFIRFDSAGCCGAPHLPRSSESQQFLGELKALMRAAANGNAADDQPLLSACGAQVSFSPPADARHGGVLETDFDAVSIATADVAAIVADSDKNRRGAQWLVIYEWDVLGVLPELEDLPALSVESFERVLLLNPHSPGYLREWRPSLGRWQDVSGEAFT
jgi:hypothetical protein